MSARVGLALLLWLVPGAGWAQKLDVSHDAIACDTVVGSASVAPALVTGGTAPSAVMRVRGSVAGCTVRAAHAVSIRSGKLSGKVTATSNECITLFEPLTGTLRIKWKADKATPIDQTTSTLGITGVQFGFFSAPWGAAYGQFSLAVSGVTGAFAGGDRGATSSNVSVTTQSVGEILAECGSPTGLRKLAIGLGRITLE